MPYRNMPPELQGKMERCVIKVMGQGHNKESAISICYTSLMGKSAGLPDEIVDAATKAVGPLDDEVLNLSYVKGLHLDEEFIADIVATKRIGRDDIQGYLALWGGKDLEGEYFTRDTDFWDSVLPLPKPLTWDHAQDSGMKADPVIGQIMEVGDDELGRWYRATLQRNHQYRRAVDSLISQRAVGTSSDSAPQYIIREQQPDGKAVWLKRWPLFAGALTSTPCEPRMLDEGALQWKSIAEKLQIAGALDSVKAAPDGAGPDGSDVERLRLWFEVLKLR